MAFFAVQTWRSILKLLLACYVLLVFSKGHVFGAEELLPALLRLLTFRKDRSDLYKCDRLLTTGKWATPATKYYNAEQFTQWLPEGCMLHNYKSRDIEACLKCKRLLLVGDSTVRQIFWETVKKLDKMKAERLIVNTTYHQSQSFSQGCTDVKFLWDPYLNSSMLNDELLAYRDGRSTLYKAGSSPKKAAAILVGGGLWHARYLGEQYESQFKHGIDKIAALRRENLHITPTQPVRPPQQRENGPDLLLLAPVPTPLFDRLSPPRAETLLPERIALMNQHLRQMSDERAAEILWSFQLMASQQKSAYEENGIHLVANVAERQADILLNLRCNSASEMQHYPFNKSCCNSAAPINTQQIMMLLMALAMSVSSLYYCAFRRKASKPLSLPTHKHSTQLVAACAVLGISAVYCFLTDRALVFDKISKVVDQSQFLTLSGLALTTGLLSFRRSANSLASERDFPVPVVDQTFLPRHQTDEWKGWMQAIILLYHYTGMSKTLWVYQVVRVLVASYLFLTGYGHTIYFLKTNDFSLHRCASVLIRLNLLSCLLTFMMRTDYDFYYFPALSSLWFLIVYATLRGRRSTDIKLLLLKIIISATTVTTIAYVPGVFEVILQSLHLIFNIHIDVHEFRFRTTLDLYVTYIGISVAALYLHAKSTPPKSSPYLLRLIRKHSRSLQGLAVLASLITLPTYFPLVHHIFPNKHAYNRFHPFISLIPILAFLTLRNSTKRLRNHHSMLFAWLGRCSLETFVLQYHIWLAGDTKGLLSLGLWHHSPFQGFIERWIDFAVITVFFLWASYECSIATVVVTKTMVGSKDAGVGPMTGNSRRTELDLGPDLGKERLSPLPKGYERNSSSFPSRIGQSLADLGRPLPLFKTLLARRLALLLGVMWVANWVSRFSSFGTSERDFRRTHPYSDLQLT